MQKRTSESTAIEHGPAQGLRWYSSPYAIHNDLCVSGKFDPFVQQCLIRYLRKGDIFYDIGAHSGFHGLVASTLVGSEGRVVSFEPVPELASIAKNQFILNDLPQCIVIQAAVSCSSDLEVSFYLQETQPGMGSLKPTALEGCWRVLPVKTVALDDFMLDQSIPLYPRVVKIDVEGTENLVLNGARKLLNAPIPPIFIIELHYPESAIEVVDTLRDYGYRFVPDIDNINFDFLHPCRSVVQLLAIPFPINLKY